MQTQQKRIVYLATPEELGNEHYYRRLWLAARNIKISRRSWLNELANTFRDFNGVVIYRAGISYRIPCLDDVFGDDPDMRWLGYYLKPDRSGDHPLSKTRKMERLRLLDLYFRIKHPDIARHFGI